MDFDKEEWLPISLALTAVTEVYQQQTGCDVEEAKKSAKAAILRRLKGGGDTPLYCGQSHLKKVILGELMENSLCPQNGIGGASILEFHQNRLNASFSQFSGAS